MNYDCSAGFIKMLPLRGILSVNVSEATAYAAIKVKKDENGLF